MGIAGWIADFSRRLGQLENIANLDSLNNLEVWLGGLFFPEAYITATRQAVAQRKKWSLETLHMRLDVERVNDPSGFIVEGLYIQLIRPLTCTEHAIGLALEGASWMTDQLALNDGETVRLNPSQVRWVQSEDSPQEGYANLPVYLNSDRSDVLFTVDLPFDPKAGALVSMRAVCLTAGG